VISIPGILFFASQVASDSRRITLSNGVVELVWLVLGCFLFFKSDQVADALFPTLDDELSINTTSRELQEVGFSLIAIYFAVGAVSRLAGLIYVFARAVPVEGQSRFTEVAQRNPENLIAMTAQLLVCIVLFFGTQGLANFWQRVRGGGD